MAPTSGRVLRVVRESEGVVTAGTALVEVGDPSVLEVAADLLTVEAVRVRPGMEAYIDHWGGPHALAARVRSVEPSGFTKVSALGVEEQRVRVILDLADSSAEWRALGDNFRVEVHIVVWKADSVLRAPTAALFRRGDAWATYVVEDGRVHARTLEVGEQVARRRRGARRRARRRIGRPAPRRVAARRHARRSRRPLRSRRPRRQGTIQSPSATICVPVRCAKRTR